MTMDETARTIAARIMRKKYALIDAYLEKGLVTEWEEKFSGGEVNFKMVNCRQMTKSEQKKYDAYEEAKQ